MLTPRLARSALPDRFNVDCSAVGSVWWYLCPRTLPRLVRLTRPNSPCRCFWFCFMSRSGWKPAAAAVDSVDSVGEPMEFSRASGDRDAGGRIPGGDPRTCTRFEVDVNWWLAGEDWSRVSYNVAARLVVRQTGAARARAELLEPVGLDCEDAVIEDGAVITPGDPAAGVERVMRAFRELLGRTAVERTAAALELHHKKLHRRSGERVGDLRARFRGQFCQ